MKVLSVSIGVLLVALVGFVDVKAQSSDFGLHIPETRPLSPSDRQACSSKIRQCVQLVDTAHFLRCQDIINTTTCIMETVNNLCAHSETHAKQLFLSNYVRGFSRTACWEEDNPLLMMYYSLLRRRSLLLSKVTKACTAEYLNVVTGMTGRETDSQFCCGHVKFLRCIVNTERELYTDRGADSVVASAYRIFSHRVRIGNIGMVSGCGGVPVLDCDSPPRSPINTEEGYLFGNQ